jgi:hypothetical protein
VMVTQQARLKNSSGRRRDWRAAYDFDTVIGADWRLPQELRLGPFVGPSRISSGSRGYSVLAKTGKVEVNPSRWRELPHRRFLNLPIVTYPDTNEEIIEPKAMLSFTRQYGLLNHFFASDDDAAEFASDDHAEWTALLDHDGYADYLKEKDDRLMLLESAPTVETLLLEFSGYSAERIERLVTTQSFLKYAWRTGDERALDALENSLSRALPISVDGGQFLHSRLHRADSDSHVVFKRSCRRKNGYLCKPRMPCTPLLEDTKDPEDLRSWRMRRMGAKAARIEMVEREPKEGFCGGCEVTTFKRGSIFWYKFMWFGKLIRKSTKQGNDKVARQMEAAHRTSLAKGEVGIREKKKIPTLGAFCKGRLEPWAKSSFETTTPNTWFWFRTSVKVICEDKHLSALPLNEVNNEALSQFAARRLEQGKKISYVNSTLRVIRRALHLAVEWDVIESVRPIKQLSGENRRDHVVTPEEERQFLAVAEKHDPEIGHVVVCLVDTGLRPEEFYAMRWEHINMSAGSYGTLFIPHGKTAAARRTIFLSARVRFILEHRWEFVQSPREGWIWPSATKSGHSLSSQR